MRHLTRRTALAAWIVVNAACGDLVRNIVGYPAWGAIVAASLVWVLVELWLLRVRIGRIPVSIAMLVVLAVASSIWAISPGWSLVASALLLGMLACTIFIAALPYPRILDVVHWSLQGLLIASFAFELFVALVLRRPLYPL